MSMIKLHEDSPQSEYKYFPIVECDLQRLVDLGGTFDIGTYTQGTSIGSRYSIQLQSDFIVQSLGANYPRSAFDTASIMKNKNRWENIEGIYQRTETVMTTIEIGEKPEDFDTSIHYYLMEMNTPTPEQPKQYIIYPPRERGDYNPSYQYYRDDSEPDKRMARLFYTDSGLSFTTFAAATTYRNPKKYFNVGCYNGSGWNNNFFVYPFFWSINGSAYNPSSDTYTGKTSARTYWIIGENEYGGDIHPPEGWGTLEDTFNKCMFFVHTRYQNADYYGIAYIQLSDNSENAYPIAIFVGVLESQYWGDCIIAGGDIPTGNWGPVSGQSGGNGTWDNTDDSATIYTPVATSTLPTATGYGGLHIYQITNKMLNKFSGLLFNPTSDNNFWSKWLNQKFNPISGIISLHVLPYQLRPSIALNYESLHVSGAILNNTYMGEDGAIVAYPVTSQYKDTSEYSLSLPEYFGSFYDYDPFTKCFLHLPFCGILNISANEIMGGSISVQYRCDCLTGNVAAMIKTTDRNGITKMHYATGNAAYSLPIVGRDDGGVDNLKSLVSGGLSLLQGNIGNAVQSGLSMLDRKITTTMQGDITGNSAPISDLKLWLEVVRVVPSTPENKQEIQGMPANAFALIYSLIDTGYAEIETVHLENIANATSDEIAEIEQILKNGVIF